MSLVLTHRWEHVLIAATVNAAATRNPECYLGRTALQKLLYFMKVTGVPMKYTFSIYHFGPFCQNIGDDVDWLLADDVISDESPDPGYSNYRPNKGWAELESRFSAELSTYRPAINNVCHALSDLSPNTLELIATLDFSFRWVKARGGLGPWRQAAVEKFRCIKKDKFADADIQKWYDSLVSAHLIEP
jgi:uncharacterized protein YwgA